MPLSMPFTTSACTSWICHTEISLQHRLLRGSAWIPTLQLRRVRDDANIGSRFQSPTSARSEICATGADLLVRHWLAAHRFIEQYRELSRLVIDIFLETRQAALQRLRSSAKWRHARTPREWRRRSGAHGDGRHQIVDPLREMFDPPGLFGSHQRIGLIKDSDTDSFRVRHCFSCHLRGSAQDRLPEPRASADWVRAAATGSVPYAPLSKSIWPSSFSIRVRTSLRSLRKSSSFLADGIPVRDRRR